MGSFSVHENKQVRRSFFSVLFMPYNKSFIDQASLVKMTGYWPRSLFTFLWTSTSSRSIKTQKENSANIQPSWPCAWSIIYTYMSVYIYQSGRTALPHLCKRAEDPETATRHVIVSPTNPKHLAPTIAMRESPATEDLVAARLSRFKKQT